MSIHGYTRATRHQNHRILICSSDFLNCIFLRKQEQLVVCMDKIKMLLGKVVCVGAAGLGNTLCFHTILLNLTVVVLCSVVWSCTSIEAAMKAFKTYLFGCARWVFVLSCGIFYLQHEKS